MTIKSFKVRVDNFNYRFFKMKKYMRKKDIKKILNVKNKKISFNTLARYANTLNVYIRVRIENLK